MRGRPPVRKTNRPTLTPEEARQRVNDYLRRRHSGFDYTVDDLLITETPGYFRIPEPCEGRCGWEPCTGTIQHTIQYAEWGLRDQKGRFVSPFRAWRALKNEADKPYGHKQ